MATAKKSGAKPGGAKKSAGAAKKRATEKKPAPTKKASSKPAPAKPPAKPLAKPVAKPAAKPPVKPASQPAKPTPKESATSTPPPRAVAPKPAKKSSGPGSVVVVTAGSAAASKLGAKWNCFRCGAKFYDLNKPQPLCPKCGADQRERPKVTASPQSAPAPRKQPRPMAPLLEDEDDGSVRYEEDIDLGVRTEIDEPDEDLFPPGEFEEDDVFSGGEEE
jgi:hypothetical protein